MKRVFVAVALTAIGLTAAIAQSDLVQQRQELMKGFGAQTRTISGMLRAQTPFDLAQARASLTTIAANANKLPTLFPDSTKGADKTEALPAIWDSKADFEKLFATLETDAKAAGAKITDEASFKAEMPKVLQTCGTCHKTYRKG